MVLKHADNATGGGFSLRTITDSMVLKHADNATGGGFSLRTITDSMVLKPAYRWTKWRGV